MNDVVEVSRSEPAKQLACQAQRRKIQLTQRSAGHQDSLDATSFPPATGILSNSLLPSSEQSSYSASSPPPSPTASAPSPAAAPSIAIRSASSSATSALSSSQSSLTLYLYFSSSSLPSSVSSCWPCAATSSMICISSSTGKRLPSRASIAEVGDPIRHFELEIYAR